MKIFVFGHKHAVMLARQLPHAGVGRTAGGKQADVKESGKRSSNIFTSSSDNCSSKSRRTNSGSWNAQGPSLTLGGVGQACPDVFASDLWEIG